MKKLRIAVLFGGNSEEREVSISSGAEVIKALRSLNHEVFAIDTSIGLLSKEEEELFLNTTINTSEIPKSSSLKALQDVNNSILKSQNINGIDVFFIMLHGGSGEDGTIQALLDTAGLTYTGSGRLGSALGLDKDISKRLFVNANIPTPNWITVNLKESKVEDIKVNFPVVIKPNLQGSSIGICFANTQSELIKGIETAKQYGNEIILEEFIRGREITVGVLGNEPLEVGEILLNEDDFFNYDLKYNGNTKEVFPANITKKIEQEAKELALRAHKTLKLEGYSRSDFRLDKNGNLWLLEVNTVPGMCKTSLFPQSAKAAGINFSELCEKICYLAINKDKTMALV